MCTRSIISSARLNEMQERYYAVESRRLEKQRLIDAEGKLIDIESIYLLQNMIPEYYL